MNGEVFMGQQNRDMADFFIQLEKDISELYHFFAEIYPEDSEFWNQLVLEENNHAALLEEYRRYVPRVFIGMSKTILMQTLEDIQKNFQKFRDFPPSPEEALNFSYLIEKNAGEAHYQAQLEKKHLSKEFSVFQVLNFADRDHAKRINEYISVRKDKIRE